MKLDQVTTTQLPTLPFSHMQTIKIPYTIYLSLYRVYRILIRQKKIKTLNFWVLTNHQNHANQPIRFEDWQPNSHNQELSKEYKEKESTHDKKWVCKLPGMKRNSGLKSRWGEREIRIKMIEIDTVRALSLSLSVLVSLYVFWGWHLNSIYTNSKLISPLCQVSTVLFVPWPM